MVEHEDVVRLSPMVAIWAGFEVVVLGEVLGDEALVGLGMGHVEVVRLRERRP